jgi:hypothetical protein
MASSSNISGGGWPEAVRYPHRLQIVIIIVGLLH